MRTRRLLTAAWRGIARALLVVAGLLCTQLFAAAGAAPQQPSRSSGISLTPAVVELKGSAGQAHRQTLSLTNHTDRVLAFELIAEDIVVMEGRRAFLPAGQRADSIAASAIFSPTRILIAPGQTATAAVTITIPSRTDVRAVAAIFRGLTEVEVQSGVAMTGSLGTLMTFTLSDDLRLDGSDITVSPQTATTNLSLAQDLRNIGPEPVVANGAIALLDATGRLLTRIPIDAQRMLPGERATIAGDYPGSLPPGRYQAVLSLGYGANLLTKSINFNVTPPPDVPDAAAR